ncbi:MAG: hypothetical protein JJE39_10300 [Vicinamibacteria bacterium]|nr:hypothetical protein [Vicinamibacteria bacterium]
MRPRQGLDQPPRFASRLAAPRYRSCPRAGCALVPGDELFYQTWGAGGYGDPLTRETARVQKDVRFRLVSPEKARDEYGVVIDMKTFVVDEEATKKLRADIASTRGPAKPFDMGPPLAEILKNCKAEMGLEPPKPPVFKQIGKMPIYKSKPSMSKLVSKKRVVKSAGAAGRGAERPPDPPLSRPCIASCGRPSADTFWRNPENA